MVRAVAAKDPSAAGGNADDVIPEEDEDDDDDDEDVEDIVEKRQARSSVVKMNKIMFANEPEVLQKPVTGAGRASTLYGISMPAPEKKKKRNFLKKLGKSMRKLGSMEM